MNKVKSIIDEWDPANLLCIYCPDNEYDDEIHEIINALPNIQDVEELAIVIQNVFTEFFGEQRPKWDYTQCLIIAKKIFSS
ncbi:YugE family protein [Clostridium omnivorum]|uniref:DUF1871 family protein n=1 Tax=Clostridium omnivorum TaxID=1604902 RepID=A0ABQ5N4K2_9CLOT|nr:YugE family protein [Clostridium sp. E14]GLC30162.1 hypothetical protein bsdE14_15720 [Clostridium sp. E14]